MNIVLETIGGISTIPFLLRSVPPFLCRIIRIKLYKGLNKQM